MFGAESVFFVVQEIVEVHATRNLSQVGVCYMLIQILSSKGQLLMSRARPVAGAVWIVTATYLYFL
jgi:hypothetical protein